MDEEVASPEAAIQSVASQVPFHDLCLLLEKIAEASGKDKKRGIFDKFLALWRVTHKRMHGDNKACKDSFFPAMRLILPHMDKERLSYGMKEVALAKYYIDVLNIAKNSSDALKLLNYRAPATSRQSAGDFASIAYIVLKSRCPEKGSLSIFDVNMALDSIAQNNADRKKDIVKKELQKMIRNMSALEQKWLIRMILKELKMGMSENSIFAAFHPDAKELYNVCSSLSKVCLDLHDPETSMNETEITIFTPFRPMLGQRAAIHEVEGLMEHSSFYIETKVDGERIQLHKDGGSYKYFSRGSNDYTSSFGASVYRGTLTPYIHDCFQSSVQSCILDGEMVGYNPEADAFVSKGSNIDIKADTLDGVHPCFMPFDILLVNGEKLANLPLKDRLQKLEQFIKVKPGRLQFVPRQDAASKEDVVNDLNDAIDRREEGIVVKLPSSVYKPSQRKGSGWLKIKPEYVDTLSDELDLLIIGGYFGSGRRGGMVSHFMLGVAVPPDNANDHPKTFHSFCKVGSGYTLKELKDLCNQLNMHWQKFDTKDPSESVVLAPGFKEKPDVWIEPSKSKIVQIKAAEITTTDKYKTGCTLRFPRLEKVRDDKQWYDCMDLDELHKLRQVAAGRLTYRKTNVSDLSEPFKKRRRILSRVTKPTTLAMHFAGADVSDVTEVSKMLQGKEFCVINGLAGYSKQDLEKKITEHGGSFVQTHGPDTYCIIADKVNVRVKNVISQGDKDVVFASWLISCLENSKVLPYKPEDMIYTSAATKDIFAQYYDVYGDSYTNETDIKQLREIFQTIKGEPAISSETMSEIEFRYFPNESPLGLFRQCRAYFDVWNVAGDTDSGKINGDLDMIILEFRFYGGNVSSEFLADVSHVVVSDRKPERIKKLREIVRKRKIKPYIIKGNWILECINRKYRLNEGPYEPL